MTVFKSIYKELKLKVKSEELIVVDGKYTRLPSKYIEFQGGHFETNDKELIERIKNTPAFKNGEVLELTEKDRKIIEQGLKSDKPANIRGAVTSVNLNSESEPIKMKEKEPEIDGEFKCDICGKVLKSKSGLNLHMISHRKDMQE